MLERIERCVRRTIIAVKLDSQLDAVRSGKRELALKCRLRVTTPPVARICSQAGQYHSDWSIVGPRNRRDGDSHNLGVRSNAELGEADARQSADAASDALINTGDCDCQRCVGGHHDGLARSAQRGVIQGDVGGRPVGGGDSHGRDHPIGGRVLRLQQSECPICVRDGEEVPQRIAVIADHPRRQRIAVHCHRRSLLGPIRERLTVPASPHLQSVVEDGDGLVVRACHRAEDGKPLISFVVAQYVARRPTALGETRYVLRTAPVMGAIAIGVADDHSSDRKRIVCVAVHKVSGIEQCLIAAQQTSARGVDDSVAAAYQHHGARTGTQDRHRILDGH